MVLTDTCQVVVITNPRQKSFVKEKNEQLEMLSKYRSEKMSVHLEDMKTAEMIGQAVDMMTTEMKGPASDMMMNEVLVVRAIVTETTVIVIETETETETGIVIENETVKLTTETVIVIDMSERDREVLEGEMTMMTMTDETVDERVADTIKTIVTPAELEREIVTGVEKEVEKEIEVIDIAKETDITSVMIGIVRDEMIETSIRAQDVRDDCCTNAIPNLCSRLISIQPYTLSKSQGRPLPASGWKIKILRLA